MRQKLIIFLSLIFPINTWSSEGFTWLGLLPEHLRIGGILLDLHKNQHVITLILVIGIISWVGWAYRKSISRIEDLAVPDKGLTLRNFVEAYGNFIYFQCRAIIGSKHAPEYFPFIATIFLVILICNLVGLIPGFLPPSEHLSTTLALGAFSFIYYNYKGCREQGTWNYIKHFAGPLWYLAILIFPIEIISHCIRPFSLALRLRSNMMGDHLVLSIFSGLAPVVVPIIFMILGLLVSIIQAYVFTVLSMVYISLAVSHGEEH